MATPGAKSPERSQPDNLLPAFRKRKLGKRAQPSVHPRSLGTRPHPCQEAEDDHPVKRVVTLGDHDRRDVSESPPNRDQYGREKRGAGRLIGRTKGGMNTKLHAICDSQGRPLNLFVTAGQVSDYIGARALLSSLPDVEWLLGDRGYDADWFRDALKDKGIRACIPGRKQRKATVKFDKRRRCSEAL